jgi:hypothetical protein
MRRTILTVLAALSLVAVPAAQAKPASEYVQSKPTPAVKAPAIIDGNLVGLSAQPMHQVDGGLVALEPDGTGVVSAPSPVVADTGSGTDSTPWIIAAAAFAMLGAVGVSRKLQHRTLLPHRHAHA